MKGVDVSFFPTQLEGNFINYKDAQEEDKPSEKTKMKAKRKRKKS